MKFIAALSFAGLAVLSSASLPGDVAVHQEEDGPLAGVEFRTFDGTDNAPNDLGSSNQPQLRLADGTAGGRRPNPRTISNEVFDQEESIVNERGLSELVTFFGQFIDHDVTFTPMNGASFPIEVPEDDDVLDIEEIEFSRSPSVDGAPVNTITSFIDGSAVYGSDEERADQLRTKERGLLKTGDGNRLPDNDGTIENEPDDTSRFFVAGDRRVNENTNLAVIHTLFLRNHNRIAREVRRAFRDFDDEQIFQTARKINVAEIQKIVYNEWLPALLGDDTGIPEFSGVAADPQPAASAFFTTAAFRVGHTLLNDVVTRTRRDGTNARPIPLNETFFAPELLRRQNIGIFLRGMANTPAQEVDNKIVDSVRNFLFTGLFEEFEELEGVDLVARNIQRGRDHRIPSYNQARRALGLSPARSFDDITSDNELAKTLEELYERPGRVDGFVGALCEDRVDGSSFGELLRASWANDFTRIRDGDRFFYLNDDQFPDSIRQLPRVQRLFDDDFQTMREVILSNTGITASQIPDNVFFAN